jgi:phage portal protein BeeE
MRLSARLTGRQKAFSQPPFWAQPGPLWGPSLPDRETIGNDFEAYAHEAYMANGVVFSCMAARMYLFSEARFAWRRFRNGQPESLFTNSELGLLERPWPGGTIGDLLGRMIQDADLCGNAYHTTVDDLGRMGAASRGGPGRRIARLRPDWVQIILGSRSGNLRDLDTRPVGYLYKPPPSPQGDSTPVLLLPGEVSHFSPVPDPTARFRGMSWLTPVVREIQADKAASRHKLKFFEQGATISTVVSLDKEITPEAFEAFVAQMRAQTEGVDMAYKTLYLGGGADVTLNGSNMQQMDFKSTQGAGETRIAAAAGMHPVIVGLSEGLQGSSLNAGNFDAAVRLTADKTIRPLWRMAAGSLERLLASPGDDAALWYDPRDVAFLQDSTTDQAEIQSKQAVTARQLLDAGFTPESVVAFLDTGSLNALEHSGLYSVQLQAPGTTAQPAPTPAPSPEEA